MAPDLLKHAGTAAKPDPRWDIYAAALVIYELMTGNHPLLVDSDGGIPLNPMIIIARQLEMPIPLLSEIRADVPKMVAACIAKGLEKDPNRRYGNMAEFDAAIRQCRRSCPELSTPPIAALPEELQQLNKQFAAAAKPEPPTVPLPAATPEPPTVPLPAVDEQDGSAEVVTTPLKQPATAQAERDVPTRVEGQQPAAVQPQQDADRIFAQINRSEPQSLAADQQIKMVVLTGPHKGSEYQVTHDRVSIGSDQRADFVLQDPSLAPFHGLLLRSQDGHWSVHDLSGSEDIKVGEAFGETHVLQHQDVIGLGGTFIAFLLSPAQAEAEFRAAMTGPAGRGARAERRASRQRPKARAPYPAVQVREPGSEAKATAPLAAQAVAASPPKGGRIDAFDLIALAVGLVAGGALGWLTF